MSTFYAIDAAPERLRDLAASLREVDEIAGAYVKPPAEPASRRPALNAMAPSAAPAPPTTPDFTVRQVYLEPAPVGIDARHAWNLPGGRGAGVRVIDLEWAWRLTHEDLQGNFGGLLGGTAPDDVALRNHGTAVVGVIGATLNGFGVTGIAADATVAAIAFDAATSASIRLAADKLNPGDIILLEIHRPGPAEGFQGRPDQRGYIPIEWWPDDYAAILYAIGKGVIVVEAAGNGAQDLDDPLYDTGDLGFPANWKNPLNEQNPNSGAIMVGAGAPPPNVHGNGNDWGPNLSRLDFSNYGSRVDAQGWGREVTTIGYGDLQGGPDEDLWYTDAFAGTSSASPIVVGAIACAQGHLKAQGRPTLTPAEARDVLHRTGTPQADAPSRPATQRIGRRPDVKAIFDDLNGRDARAETKLGDRPHVVAQQVSLEPGRKVTITVTVDPG